ncbi:outer membrane beta-barrel protein [Leadbetterella sp. DM7]|uniref:outer membrane beta-barrel protein n=1 Tax=Leadbetterella sp. DM7 TaxID=3235085 RepID=UPI00349E9ECC
MKNTFILLLGLILTFPALALPPQKISGYVKDTTAAAVPFAVVGLASYTDSALLKFEITDEKGFFEFESVLPGHYFLKVSSTGFQEFTSSPFEVSDAAAQHNIVLSVSQNHLDEVTVSATKPVIEFLPGRLIFNVDQLISASGGNAFDLLSQAPGVTVNSDGLVNLRGKPDVLVLMDNRENFIHGDNLATFLKGLPADQILSLEIISRPSAKYAASGTGGIINIKTKKYAQRGFGINVSSGLRQGINFNTNNNLAVNWRNEKFYIFGNYGYVRNGVYHNLKMKNTFLSEEGKTLSQTEQGYEVSLKNNTNSVQTGIDFTYKKTFLGISYSGIFENHLPRNQVTNTDIFDASHQLIEIVRGERLRTRNVRRNTVNFNYVQSFARPGSELTVAADFFNYDLDMNYTISNAFHRLDTGTDTTVNFIQAIPNTMKVYSAKADYTYPLSENSTFQAGLRSSFSRMNNVYNFSLSDPSTGQYRLDPVRSIHYTFNEDIHSGYINFLHTFSETFDIEAGLRLENTTNTSIEKRTMDRLDKSYTRLFPDFMINYNPGENHSYSLGYSRRFNRPEYTTLIPAYLYTDLLYYVYGNPHQDPEMVDNADISYTFMGKLTANLNFSYLDRMFFTAFIANAENHSIGETTINHGHQRSAAFSIDYSDRLKPWYSLTLSSTLGHRKTETGEEKNIAKGYYFQGQMTNRFSLGKGWSAEVAGVFTSGQYESFEYYLNRFGYMVLGLGKTLFKGKGSIKAQMRDPFYSMVYDYDTRFPTVIQKWVLRQDSRQAGLTFSYRFSSGNETKTRSRIISNEEEKERYKE